MLITTNQVLKGLFSYCILCISMIIMLYLLLGGAGAEVGPPDPDPES